MTLLLYGLCLVTVLCGYGFAKLGGDEFRADLYTTSALCVLILAFALAHRSLLRGLLGHVGFGWRGYALIALVSVPVVLLVYGYVEWLAGVFRLHLPGELDHFAGHHWAWALLLLVVLPPLSEEVAFRGLIYTGLRRGMSVREAAFVSSIAFCILHLSIPALLTHLPLGLYLCWLRQRSGSLWPAVFAHACHNAGVFWLSWPPAG